MEPLAPFHDYRLPSRFRNVRLSRYHPNFFPSGRNISARYWSWNISNRVHTMILSWKKCQRVFFRIFVCRCQWFAVPDKLTTLDLLLSLKGEMFKDKYFHIIWINPSIKALFSNQHKLANWTYFRNLFNKNPTCVIFDFLVIFYLYLYKS